MNISGIISHFVVFAFLMIFMWIGVTYVSQNIQYSSAKQFYNSVICQLEEQQFSQEIIRQCRENAERNGYELTIETYGSEKDIDARVILKLTYVYPIIQTSRHYQIDGYAR